MSIFDSGQKDNPMTLYLIQKDKKISDYKVRGFEEVII